MQVRLIALAFAALALLAPRLAAATPAQELEAARELFRAGKFSAAIPGLNYLLYPTPRLSQQEDLVEAHVLLGVCAFESGDARTARRELEEALFLDPAVGLDTLIFSASAVEFFADVKKDLEEREARDAEQRRLAEENERLQRYLDAMVVIETRPFYINFIPFGAGQFQNGERTKGLAFAVAQGITGGLSAGIWLYLVGEYGLPGKLTNPTPEEVDRVRLLQQIEIGAGSVCLGLMAWGIVDSLLHYQPSVRRAPDESLLPPELRQKNDKPATSRLRVEPLIPAGGAGLSLTWEY